MTTMRMGILAGVLAVGSLASAATVTRGPYLQTPTPASMIVRWRTDLPTSSRVAIGAAPGSLGTNFDDAIPTTEHIVTVTGLTPATQYYYSVGSLTGAFVGDDADHYFRAAPTTGATTPFRLWTIGDAGFTNADLDDVRDAFKAYNGGTSATDLFLLLGDNAYLTGTDAQYQAAVFNEHAEMLRTTPVYSTFGNHERFSSMDLTQTGPYFDMFSFPIAAQAGGVASGTESYYSFDYANVHFISLDSEDFTPTSASGPMLTWLQADLAATTADWVVALWHRPPYSRGLLHNSDTETNEINMRQYVLPVLEGVGVDVVLCGHSHSYERSYFLDGHYGLASTFTDAFKKDLGDGDPAGDGAYRKDDVGPISHSGAVYVVNGSGSEVRNNMLNHPAHIVGLLTLGSMVIDVDGNTLTARFLSSTGNVDDQFRIVKGTTCAPTPATGCNTAVRGKLTIRENPNVNSSRWSWKWKGGTIDPMDVGDPTGETDMAVCVYDAAGTLVGGALPHGVAEWRVASRGFEYKDPNVLRHGFQKIRIRTGTPSLNAYVQAKGKGALIGNPTLPVTLPVTAQLVNLDNGKCWASQFTTTRKNLSDRVLAVIP
jgi:acid phosphatase type 7